MSAICDAFFSNGLVILNTYVLWHSYLFVFFLFFQKNIPFLDAVFRLGKFFVQTLWFFKNILLFLKFLILFFNHRFRVLLLHLTSILLFILFSVCFTLLECASFKQFSHYYFFSFLILLLDICTWSQFPYLLNFTFRDISLLSA